MEKLSKIRVWENDGSKIEVFIDLSYVIRIQPCSDRIRSTLMKSFFIPTVGDIGEITLLSFRMPTSEHPYPDVICAEPLKKIVDAVNKARESK